MQHLSAAPAIELGVPSKCHWILSNGFGDMDLPPEEGGLPKEIGQAIHTPSPLRPGLEVYSYECRLRSPISVRCEYLTDKPYLWLSHTFSGNGEYRQGRSFNGAMSDDWSCCAILRDPVSDYVYAAENHAVAGVLITPDRLVEMLHGQRPCRAFNDFIDGHFDPSVISPRPTGTLRNIARQIFSNPYHGPMRSVFLEAKAFEMLAEYLGHLSDSPASPCRTPPARRRAQAAKDLIMANLSDPPRIEDVARQVGLSQRHLAELFQDMFGASPLQCLTQWRLEEGQALLARGDLSVKQVAHRMGYAHVSSFSYAYARRYGHPPSSRR